jgi:hypothetical protein
MARSVDRALTRRERRCNAHGHKHRSRTGGDMAGQLKDLIITFVGLAAVAACSSATSSSADAIEVTGPSVPPTAADPHYEQAETRISVQTFAAPGPTIVDVVYNDFTGEWANNLPPPQGFITYDASGNSTWYPGASVMGYSVSTDGGGSFSYPPLPTKLRPPNYGQPGGWDLLRGDPSITSSLYDQHYVYMANLATSDAALQSVGGVMVNGNAPIDGACIARSTDAGQTFHQIALGDCLAGSPGPLGRFAAYDGSDMVADWNQNVYAAFADLTAQRFDSGGRRA